MKNSKSSKFTRIAIRGDANWGQYMHDAGIGAAGGAAGGALIGGVGAVPGAIGGAVSGAAGSALNDVWYNYFKSNDQKASWQAGDILDKAQEIAKLARGVQNPEVQQLAGMLATVANQFKAFMDRVVENKEDVSIKDNMFANLAPKEAIPTVDNAIPEIHEPALKEPQIQASSKFRVVEALENDYRADLSTGWTDDAAIKLYQRSLAKRQMGMTPHQFNAALKKAGDEVAQYAKIFARRGMDAQKAMQMADQFVTQKMEKSFENWAMQGVRNLADDAVRGVGSLGDDVANQGLRKMMTPGTLMNGVKGLGVGMVGGIAADATLGHGETFLHGGNSGMMSAHLNDIEKMSTAIINLTKDSEKGSAVSQAVQQLMQYAGALIDKLSPEATANHLLNNQQQIPVPQTTQQFGGFGNTMNPNSFTGNAIASAKADVKNG